jgi:hypothetical protein
MCTSTLRRWPVLAMPVFLIATCCAANAAEDEVFNEKTTQQNVEVIFESLDTISFAAMARPAETTDPRAPPARFTDGRIAKDLETIKRYAALVEEEDRKRTGLGGKITFGGGSDESKSADKSKVNVGAELTLGTYPGQLRLKFESAVEQNASSIKENVTSIVASYDHYIKPGREAYGFLERFTDSFLDIDQRYEIGLGMKFEWTKKGSYERKEFFRDFIRIRSSQLASNQATSSGTDECEEAYTRAGCTDMGKLLKAREAAEDSLIKVKAHAATDPVFGAAVNELVEAVNAVDLTDILNGRRKASTKLELAFAIGALAEFEMPSALKRQVETLGGADTDGDGTPDEVLATAERAFNQPSGQRFRLSLRPSVVWRLGQRTEIFAKAYYKPALDSPRSVNGVDDYRVDVYAGLKWKLPGIQKKDSNAIITLNYELHYDNLPPESAETLAADERFVAESLPLVSAKRHRMIKLGVEIPL